MRRINLFLSLPGVYPTAFPRKTGLCRLRVGSFPLARGCPGEPGSLPIASGSSFSPRICVPYRDPPQPPPFRFSSAWLLRCSTFLLSACQASKNRLPTCSVAGCATDSAHPQGAHAKGGASKPLLCYRLALYARYRGWRMCHVAYFSAEPGLTPTLSSHTSLISERSRLPTLRPPSFSFFSRRHLLSARCQGKQKPATFSR